MKNLLFSLVGLGIFISQLHSISITEYIRQHGIPQIDTSEVWRPGARLDLSAKDLTDLTGLEFIENIGKVTYLDLSDNKLEKLPPDGIFKHVPYLLFLNLDNNNLQSLPENAFVDLGNLRYLRLDNNQLESLHPRIFSSLDNLRDLSLQNNKLKQLPVTLFHGLSELYSLDLRGNPFDPTFISDLRKMIEEIDTLVYLNGENKQQALKRQPFKRLTDIAIEEIQNNLDEYYDRLHELPAEILDQLNLTDEEREEIEQRQKE